MESERFLNVREQMEAEVKFRCYVDTCPVKRECTATKPEECKAAKDGKFAGVSVDSEAIKDVLALQARKQLRFVHVGREERRARERAERRRQVRIGNANVR